LGAGTINQIADQIRQKYSHNNSNCTKNSWLVCFCDI
jgi:hypothetical protein